MPECTNNEVFQHNTPLQTIEFWTLTSQRTNQLKSHNAQTHAPKAQYVL